MHVHMYNKYVCTYKFIWIYYVYVYVYRYVLLSGAQWGNHYSESELLFLNNNFIVSLFCM